LVLLAVIIGGSLGTAYAHQSLASKSLTVSVPDKSETTTAPVPKGPAQSNTMFATYPTWAQDFATDKSSTLNSRYWNVYQGPAQSNNEAEYYTDNSTNLRISDGALTIEATHQSEPQGYNYASARIDTENKQSFLYGRIDITAKLPTGVGTWPAAWFLPANTKYEDLSPSNDDVRYLNGGELDLVEQVGTNPNTEYGIVHTESDLSNPGGVGDYNTVTVNDNAYNLYSLLWTPTSITFEVNNVPFFTYTKAAGANYTTWPFNQPFYLILNLALGGSWGGEDTAQYPLGIDNAALPAAINVQSIYYYPYNGSAS
jgi:beta-glucanase (GH16 family)